VTFTVSPGLNPLPETVTGFPGRPDVGDTFIEAGMITDTVSDPSLAAKIVSVVSSTATPLVLAPTVTEAVTVLVDPSITDTVLDPPLVA